MVSVVNGYICFSSCDEATARQGKDPQAPPGSPPGTSSKDRKTSGFDAQPATVLDGLLKDLTRAVGGVSPSGSGSTDYGAASGRDSQSSGVNILA
jgi:hypothetical protein